MLTFIVNAIKIIFLLGILVFIHEGGHFIVAKLCKVRVNEFALGFGKTIISKKIGETTYALRIIPLGGFVRMEGEEQPSEEKGSFSKAKIWQKILIVAAGGLVNIIFAILIVFLLVIFYYGYTLNETLQVTGTFAYSIIDSIKMLFSGNVTVNELVGPVGISSIIVQTTELVNYIYLIKEMVTMNNIGALSIRQVFLFIAIMCLCILVTMIMYNKTEINFCGVQK